MRRGGGGNPVTEAVDLVRSGWHWFRARPLPLQLAAWAAIAVGVAVVGLAVEQRPPNSNPYAQAPDAGGGGQVGGQVVTNSGGPEGADVQQQAGATHVEVGAAKVGAHFRATNLSVTRLFNQTLNSRGRAGLNANQLISVNCANGNCVIKYVPDGPGAGRIIEAQGPIWETLLKDPTWKAATIEALPGGPDIAGRGRPGGGPPHGGGPPPGAGPPAVVISCTRAQAQSIGVWGVQSGPLIERTCRVGHTENKGA